MLRNRPTVEVLDDLISRDSNIPLSLNQIEEISRSLLSETVIHVTKTDRVYEALRQIGVPSHYSQIADTYNDMFPDDYSTENVIHATLSRKQDRIVWIGMRGTFALKEWGFERPSDTLFNTVAEIVKEQYSKNGKPVAINTIQAELGKYRKVVNLNSVILASYCNEQITNVYKDYFIPIEFSEKIPVANGDTDSELLDRILRQFETQVNKEESTIMPEQISFERALQIANGALEAYKQAKTKQDVEDIFIKYGRNGIGYRPLCRMLFSKRPPEVAVRAYKEE